VFEFGTTLVERDSGTEYIPDGTEYRLAYLRILDLTSANVVLDTTITEKFKNYYNPILLEIASAIANEQGMQQVMALSKALVDSRSA
jgi:BarA-like signal transduction histidine kinase